MTSLHNFHRYWLANKLELSTCTLQKCVKTHFDQIIASKFIVSVDNNKDDRQIEGIL